MGEGKEDCEGADSAGRREIQDLPAAGELGLLSVHGGAGQEAKMKRQPGLKITAQGVIPDWFPRALPALERQRSERKQESQRAAEQLDIITPEKVLEHFNAAERAGVWIR